MTELYVICAQDCNKHFPKIIACCVSVNQCINFLNRVGEKIEPEFNILAHQVMDNEDLPSVMTFAHKKLFTELYSYFCNVCMHKGEIHIFTIKFGESFDDIYELLSMRYM